MISFQEYLKNQLQDQAAKIDQLSVEYAEDLPDLLSFLKTESMNLDALQHMGNLKGANAKEIFEQLMIGKKQQANLELKAERQFKTMEMKLIEKGVLDSSKLNALFDEYVSDFEDWLEENEANQSDSSESLNVEQKESKDEIMQGDFHPSFQKILAESKEHGSNPQTLVDEFLSLVKQSKIDQIPGKFREMSFQGVEEGDFEKIEAEIGDLLGGARFTKAVISSFVLSSLLEVMATVQANVPIKSTTLEKAADITEMAWNLIKALSDGFSEEKQEWQVLESSQNAELLNKYLIESESNRESE